MKNFPTKKNLNKSLKFTHQYLLQVTCSSEKQCYVQNIWKNVFDQVPISFFRRVFFKLLNIWIGAFPPNGSKEIALEKSDLISVTLKYFG